MMLRLWNLKNRLDDTERNEMEKLANRDTDDNIPGKVWNQSCRRKNRQQIYFQLVS